MRLMQLKRMVPQAAIAALLLVAILVPVVAAQSAPRLSVLTPALNVRSGPGTTYPVINVLHQGADVEIVGRHAASGWWQVRLAAGSLGWVTGSQDLVRVNGATAGVPEVAAPAQTAAPAAASAGGLIAFQVASGGPIFVVNANGTGLRQLTTGIDPALSPDGRNVAFTRWESATTGTLGSLWVINVDGSGERVIANNLRQPKSPSWSPDGKQIVVNVQHGGTLDNVRVCGRTMPPPDAYDIEEIKERDGSLREICFTVPADPRWIIQRVNVADGSTTDLASDTHAFSPTWNPALSWQVVYHSRQGLASLDVNRDANWQITSEPGDRSPVFSPDGQRIALSYYQHDHWEVYVMNADGSGRTRLTETPYTVLADQTLKGQPTRNWNNVAPSWSPDGSKIAFLTDRNGSWEVWVMSAVPGQAGSNQRPLLPAGALRGLTIQFRGVDERVISWR